MSERRTAEQWKTLQDFFREAEALDSVSRHLRLAELHLSHPELAEDLRRLLEAHDRIGKSDDDLDPAEEVVDRIGTTIGPYRIEQVIGRGGFGVVYLASQDNPVKRRVAVKLMRGPRVTPGLARRFRAERQALAMLDHPAVATIIDGGAEADGSPYLVMEYVPGEPIRDYCEGRGLGIRDRLALFEHACRAVHHAHLRLVIHRDIKPSNILVVHSESGPMIKVIDFGLAKILDKEMAAATPETRDCQIMGTPAYMAPEQLAGDRRNIDALVDVYALGVVLYELLSGTSPWGDVPQDPLAAAAKIRGGTPKPLAQSAPTLRGDLAVITDKAVAPDRMRRYQSAAELADDVRRYLDDLPITARAASTVYQLRKMASRNRPLVTLAGVAAMLIIAAAIVIALQHVSLKQSERTSTQTLQDITTFFSGPTGHETPGRALIATIPTAARPDDNARTIIMAPDPHDPDRRLVLRLRNADDGVDRALFDQVRIPDEYPGRLRGQVEPFRIQACLFEDVIAGHAGREIVLGRNHAQVAPSEIVILNTELETLASIWNLGHLRNMLWSKVDNEFFAVFASNRLPRYEPDLAAYGDLWADVDDPSRSHPNVVVALSPGDFSGFIYPAYAPDAAANMSPRLMMARRPAPVEVQEGVRILEINSVLPPTVDAASFRLVVRASPRDADRVMLEAEFGRDGKQLTQFQSQDGRTCADLDVPEPDLLFIDVPDRRRVQKTLHDAVGAEWRLDEAEAYLQRNGRIDPEVAREVMQIISLLRADADWLNQRAWEIVSDPNRTTEAYAAALGLVEQAVLLRPGDAGALNTRGVAQFRLGHDREAIESLQASDVLYAAIENAAFLAMAFDRLGESEAARNWLDEAQRRFARVAGPDGEPHPHLEEAVRTVAPR